MKPSDPEWYDAIKGNPLQRSTFTDELAATIIQRAKDSSEHRKPKFKQVSLAGLGILCFLGFLLIANEAQLFHTTIQPDSTIGNRTANPNPPVERMESTSTEKNLSNQSWETLINQGNQGAAKTFIYKESLLNDVTLVFSKQISNFAETELTTLGVNMFKWNSSDWSTEQSATYSVQESDRRKNIITAWVELDTIPIFFGMAPNKTITQIRISDENHTPYEATILREHSGAVYWFAALPEKKDGYTVEALTADGTILESQTYYYH
ncbi:hypothetical protein [Paenibacillus luteus]|uniref:hypothetical protein n=1 Tax=Paenibacillus luteus TaxID=2545753 RepID=UPI001141B2E8|nr:hypothetical protein [Paenibacillus luteus]